jgi:hypothetical protein
VFQQLGSDALWTLTFVLGLVVTGGFVAMSVPARRRAARLAAETSPAPT